MALTDNKIGPHQFIALSGALVPPMPTTMIDDRHGVDGSEILLTGKKGRPFSLISQVDAESYSAAVSVINEYALLIDQAAVEVVQGGASTTTDGYACKVLGIEPLPPRAIRSAVGGLNSPSLAWVTCRWDLLAIPLEEEE